MKRQHILVLLPALMAVVMMAVLPQATWASNHYDAGYESTSQSYSTGKTTFTIKGLRIYNYQGNNSHFATDPKVDFDVYKSNGMISTSSTTLLLSYVYDKIYASDEGNEDYFKSTSSDFVTNAPHSYTTDDKTLTVTLTNVKVGQTVTGDGNGNESSKWTIADLQFEYYSLAEGYIMVLMSGTWRDYSDGVNENEDYNWTFLIPVHTCNSSVSSATSTYLKTAATCTAAAVYYKSCSLCGKAQSSTFTSGSALGHSLSATAAKAATCTEAGNTAYWHCSTCNKYFSNSSATTETTLAATAIAAKGHSMTKTAAVAATCTDVGRAEYYTCSRSCCEGKYYKDVAGNSTYANYEATAIAAKGHSMTKTAAVAATCSAAGRAEYYTCSRSCCEGKYYKDVAGNSTYTDYAATEIAATGNHNIVDNLCANCNHTFFYYTSSDGNIVTPYVKNVFNVSILSNTYENGQGCIEFNGKLTSIGEGAFSGCSGFTGNLTIPNSVTSIGQ